MLYQLRNGKVIEMSVEQYLDCTDEDLQYLMCLNAGDVVVNTGSTPVDQHLPTNIVKITKVD